MDNKYLKLRKQRKRLQEKGLIPDFLTTGSWLMLTEKYISGDLNDDYAYLNQFDKMCETLARYTNDYEYWKATFFEYIWNGWLVPSTNQQANCGTEKGLTVSCSGQYVHDSIDGFYSSRRETALLTKQGFGTSAYLGDIRPRGAPISWGGKASGILPVLQGFVQDSRDVSQGSTRRGAVALYLEPEHQDFWEVIHELETRPDDINIGWCITDDFARKWGEKDPETVKKMQRILKVKMLTGKGYFWFVDKVNRQLPQVYKDDGLKNYASNLCVVGNTIIRVKVDGEPPVSMEIQEAIKRLENHKVEVFSYNFENNECYNEILNGALTRENADIVRVSTRLNNYLQCTPDHLIYTLDHGYIEADKLMKGDKLLSSDGEYIVIDAVDEVEALEFKRNVYDITVDGDSNFFANDILVHNCTEIALPSSEDLTYTCVIASLNYSLYDEWKDRNVIEAGVEFLNANCSYFIEKASKLEGLEKAVRFTKKYRAIGLGVLGFHTLLQKRRQPYESVEAFLTNEEIFSELREKAEKASAGRNASLLAVAPNKSCVAPETKIKLADGHVIEFYDILEMNGLCKKDYSIKGWHSINPLKVKTPKGEKTVTRLKFNGFEETLVLRFENYYKEEYELICTANHPLLNTAGEWVEAENITVGMEFDGGYRLVRSFKNRRRIATFDIEVPEEHCYILESGIVSHNTSILVGGVSEGINLMPTNVFLQTTPAGEIKRVNPVLLDLMKERGVATKANIKEVEDAFGSVQGVSWLTDEEKEIFKTAWEIDQSVVVDMASARGPYLDQWQSVNLTFAADADEREIARVHKKAFDDENIRGLYYVYSMAGVTGSKDACESCAN